MILFLKKYIQVDYISILSLTEDRLFPHHGRISGNYGNKYKLHQTHEKKCLCNEYDRDSWQWTSIFTPLFKIFRNKEMTFRHITDKIWNILTRTEEQSLLSKLSRKVDRTWQFALSSFQLGMSWCCTGSGGYVTETEGNCETFRKIHPV